MATVGLCLLGKTLHGFALIPILVAVLLATMNFAILPSADSFLSTRSASRECFQLDPSGQNVMVFGLPRDLNYGVDYYFGRELAEWLPSAPLPEWLFTNKEEAVLFERRGGQFHVENWVGEPRILLVHVLPPLRKSP